MKISPVVYSGGAKVEVDKFERLPASKKLRSYWDEDDKLIDAVKGEIKQHYLRVQDYTCPYCRQRIVVKHGGAWDIEHIIPRDSHPHLMFAPENLCVACKDCNGAKGKRNVLADKRKKRLSKKAEAYLICHPHFDEYEEHINILAVSRFYLPKTDKGRFTVEVCGLLRFVYKYASYDGVACDMKASLGRLHDAYMAAVDSLQQAFILECIRDLATKGCEQTHAAAIKKLMSDQQQGQPPQQQGQPP